MIRNKGFYLISKIFIKLDKEKAVRLVCNGKKVDEVAKLYNVTARTIRDWLKQSRQPMTQELTKEVIKLIENGFQKRQIVQKLLLFPQDVEIIRARYILFKYLQGVSIHEIEIKYKVHHSEIDGILENFGISRISQTDFFTLMSRLKDPKNIPTSQFLFEIIIGNIMGDGNLKLISRKEKSQIKIFFNKDFNINAYSNASKFFCNIKNLDFDFNRDYTNLIKDFNFYSNIIVNSSVSCLRLGKSIFELPFLEQCLLQMYEKYNYKVNLAVKLKKHYNQRNYTENYKVSLIFQASSSVQMTQIYFEWYPEQIKIIPRKSFNLTSNSLLIWYVDDGSYSKHPRENNPNSFRHSLNISTESFTKEENEFLIEEIFSLTGIRFLIQKSKNNRWQIGISSKKDIKTFLEFLSVKSDKFIFDSAKRAFPWKFDLEKNKSYYLENLRMINDPLVTLYDLKINESEIDNPEITLQINSLLEKTGSNLRFSGLTKIKQSKI